MCSSSSHGKTKHVCVHLLVIAKAPPSTCLSSPRYHHQPRMSVCTCLSSPRYHRQPAYHRQGTTINLACLCAPACHRQGTTINLAVPMDPADPLSRNFSKNVYPNPVIQVNGSAGKGGGDSSAASTLITCLSNAVTVLCVAVCVWANIQDPTHTRTHTHTHTHTRARARAHVYIHTPTQPPPPQQQDACTVSTPTPTHTIPPPHTDVRARRIQIYHCRDVSRLW